MKQHNNVEQVYLPDAPQLRVAGRVQDSVVDGPGLRYTLFLQGCPHRCPGCHNPETHNMHGGTLVHAQQVLDEVLSNPLLFGVTLSGGEPFCQSTALVPLVRALKAKGLHLAAYSGYTFEDLRLHPEHLALLELLDMLVDGAFILEKRNLLLRFRGSSNQRVLDVPTSLNAQKAVLLWNEEG